MKSLQKTDNYMVAAKTPHGIVQYNCKTKLVKANDIIQYLDKRTYDALCRQGCPNYNKKWSCPPYAPDFAAFVKPFRYVDVIMLLVEMEKIDYIKNNYLKIKAANSILKSRMDKALRLGKGEDEFYISTGSCRLCKPCKRKLDQSCAHPKEHTYSFEALGINVSAMTRDLFQTDLLWYKEKILPRYTCVVGGLMTNHGTFNDKIVKKLVQLE